MSDAADRLARSRLAILQQLERREGRRGERSAEKREQERVRRVAAGEPEEQESSRFGGWFGSVKNALNVWWRHHPAHMGVELATPMLSAYARKKPLQFLGIAAALGAVVVVARPWRLMSATGLVVALLKSSQISNLVMSAMAGADFGKDQPPYE